MRSGIEGKELIRIKSRISNQGRLEVAGEERKGAGRWLEGEKMKNKEH